MRTKLLSSIVLGTMALAGVASADPYYVRDHRAQPTITVQPAVSFQASVQANLGTRYSRPIVVDHRYNPQPTTYGYQISANGQWAQGYEYGRDPYVEGIARGEWYTLGDRLRFDGNQNHGKIMDLNGSRLSAIELQSEGGCSTIAKVAVILSDGSTMALVPGRNLDAHAPNLRIDLGARGRVGVSRVIVYGTGAGQFRILGA